MMAMYHGFGPPQWAQTRRGWSGGIASTVIQGEESHRCTSHFLERMCNISRLDSSSRVQRLLMFNNVYRAAMSQSTRRLSFV